jgi:chromate transporter
MEHQHTGSAQEVLATFTRLGLSSFGGPVAHLGYFRAELVTRRRWVDEATYADLVALCQFLPGPASSQTGFALGLIRAGYLGGLAAWVGFTGPAAVLLVLFAAGSGRLSAWPTGAALLAGLQLVAVAVVAQAVWGMARSLCPDRTRAGIATVAALISLFAPISIAQIAAILCGAAAGLVLCRAPPNAPTSRTQSHLAGPISSRAGTVCLVVFAALLLLLPWCVSAGFWVRVFDAFYRAGALVFGGGHVVLPLLRDAVVTPGWVSEPAFLAGYGAAQAMPGPLFTFAAYLGASLPGAAGGVGGAVVAVVAIFLPGILLLIGVLPFWAALRARPGAQAAMAGVNATVVGLLGAALYDPVWTSAVHNRPDFAVVLVGFMLLVVWRASPLLVVALGAGAAMLRTVL